MTGAASTAFSSSHQKTRDVDVIYMFLFFFIPFIIPALPSRSLPVITQIRGHIAGPSPSSPLRYVPSSLSRKDPTIFFPCRFASNCDIS